MPTLFRNKADRFTTLADIIRKGEAFKNSTGTFHGSVWTSNYAPTYGRMSMDNGARMTMHAAKPGINYVVWSYRTPIAYRLNSGEWIQPNATYSRTTIQHKGVTATAISVL